jgi:tetratricopeptide (TPR) repeat protein
LEAYSLFLQARSQFATNALSDAVDNLKLAVELDPGFAEAYELMALGYWTMAGSYVKSGDGQRMAFEAAGNALSRNPDLPLAQALHRSADLQNYTYMGEIEAVEQLIREQPGNADAYDMLAYDLIEAGYIEEGLNAARRLHELDPLSPRSRARLADALLAAGRLDELESMLEVWRTGHYGVLGDRYVFAGRFDAAAQRYQSRLRDSLGMSDVDWVRDAIDRARDPASGAQYIDQMIAEQIAGMPDENKYDAWRFFVNWYAVFGHLDRFIEVIQSLDLSSSTWTDADVLVYVATIERNYTGFTAHPKYLDVANSMGITGVWDQRGAPDFCEKNGSDWVCH